MQKKTYKNYEDYLKIQMSRHKHKKCFSVRRERIQAFCKVFECLGLPNETRCLCVGARYGEEVVAASCLYHYAIGIDLVPYRPLVIKGDMHDLRFEDNEFDLIYTNAVDHIYDVEKCFSEKRRVLREGGILIIDNFYGEGEPRSSSVIFTTPEEIIKCSGMKLKSHTPTNEKFIWGVTDRTVLENTCGKEI